MHLWNDYEGKTIADAYPLEKLIRPEGRSAFFVTPNGNGAPNVIRLTESLNDEHEMLERWRQVSQVHQENLVAIKTFGQTTFDGVPLAYALMEPTDANLGDILAERPLTAAETREVGISLVAALSALHGMELIHEHVEPANVLASGEVIKLRSDCVRECAGDPEFSTQATCQELKQRDVHDLCMLLLRCLTLEKKLTPAIRLPAPFDKIIPRGVEGSWGLAEMSAALQPPTIKPLVPEGVLPQRGPAAAPDRLQTRLTIKEPARSIAAFPETLQPTQEVPAPQQSPLPFPSASPAVEVPTLRVRRVDPEQAPLKLMDRRVWIGAGGAAVLLLLLIWLLVPSKHVDPVVRGSAAAAPAASGIQTIDDAPGPKPATPEGHAEAFNPATVKTSSPARDAAAHGEAGWRVVCYTFLHEDQAWNRAGAIRRDHSSLNPQVFALTRTGPYFVTLGSAMSRSEAETTLKRARRAGLPRDTFLRFYPAR